MNRLAKETSLYLKQHENNPVDWYPWGEEALETARRLNKPILLSVGYSACHWCHVMAHECFENSEIAAKMNEHFVCIKVDRELRPDLDHLYQPVAQAIVRSGGWPLTVFLKPDLTPFFGGTYFPPTARHGMPAFGELLESLAQAYQNDPAAIEENSKKLLGFITKIQGTQGIQLGSTRPQETDFKALADELLGHCDPEWGGLGGAPKFPNTMVFTYLWRMGVICTQDKWKEAAVLALRKMAQGGIFDQLGGGFHRYSVDATWSVPHFEKMLYDNGLLLKLYSEVLASDLVLKLISDDDRELFNQVVIKTVLYLLNNMQDEAGGFFASSDADTNGEEGLTFVWSEDELSFLTSDQRELFCKKYGITSEGNFEGGKTVLHLSRKVEDPNGLLNSAEQRVMEERAKRPQPAIDRKVIPSWNALAVSGLAWASYALKAQFPEIADKSGVAAWKAYKKVQKQVSDRSGFLEDYAYLSSAALDLLRICDATPRIEELRSDAKKYLDVIVQKFGSKDRTEVGYFMSEQASDLVVRPKALFDQAIPSGTAVALESMAYLKEDWRDELASQLDALFALCEQNPYSCAGLLNAALLESRGAVSVSGEPPAMVSAWLWHPFTLPKAFDGELQLCQSERCFLPDGQAVSSLIGELRF